MSWLLLVHDPTTIVSELGFPAAIAIIVTYALLRITNKFTDFLIKQNERQSENLGAIQESIMAQKVGLDSISEGLKEVNRGLGEVHGSMREMTKFWRELNGDLRRRRARD